MRYSAAGTAGYIGPDSAAKNPIFLLPINPDNYLDY
jgi:hypothetical protein